MDASTALADILSLNQMAMHTVVDGFSADQLVAAPVEGGTPALWILGHIAVNRVRLAHQLGSSREEVAEPEWAPGFETGATPPVAIDGYPTVTEVLDLYDHAHSLAVVGLANMTDEQLEEEPLFNGKNRLEHTLYIAWHEAYHLGQFGPIRRTLGLPKLA